MGNKLVIYHSSCSDGMGAAWAFYKQYPDAEFYAARHDGSEPPNVDGKDVYIVDFCYSPDILLQLQTRAKSLLVLDHHKSAMEKCGYSSNPEIMAGEVVFTGTRIPVSVVKGLIARGFEDEIGDYIKLTPEQRTLATITTFDMKRSGAGMAWDYCFPENRYWLINYIEDKDLWNWKLPNSREINANIQSYPITFETYDMLAKRKPDDLILEGAAILRANQNMVNDIVRKAREVDVLGNKVMVVNSPVLQSEVAGFLAKGRAFGMSWFENEHGERIYSLRSDKDGLDVAEIAAKLGNGGGHKRAAGMRGVVL